MTNELAGIKALAFDTGGTILDWHSGISRAFAHIGDRHRIERDWPALTNEYRRRSLKRIIDQVDPAFTMDDVHREVLDEILAENGLGAFTSDDRHAIWLAWHQLDAWPDFAPALALMRRKYVVVSFTVLSLPMIIHVSRRNGIEWDGVLSCELMRIYKTLPDSYRRAAAHLALKPEEIMMVACHNFDLMAARQEGYRSAFVHRPDEWGKAGPPDPTPNPVHDIAADDFYELAAKLNA